MASTQKKEDRHVYCFVPGEGIDVVCLAAYLKTYIDGSANIRPSRHPRDDTRVGFTVGARSTLAKETLEDVMNDTKDWVKEQQGEEFQEQPYDYQESDTWKARRKKGQTPYQRASVVGERRRAPVRHDPRYPATPSEFTSSTVSSQVSSTWSRARDEGSQYSAITEEVDPSDSISQAGSRHAPVQKPRGGGGGRGGGRGGGGTQPGPDTFSADFSRMSFADNTRPNQALPRTTAGGRHDPDPKEDNKSGKQYTSKSSDRKESLDPYGR